MRTKVGNGSLRLPMWGGKFYTVFGGPYMDKPRHFAGVKMAVEIDKSATVRINTHDFKTPPVKQLNSGLDKAVQLILKRRRVYVGCMGGRGRTGLFMAVLAKSWGIEDPVGYVRRNYYPHAVETKDQYKFVEDYRVPVKTINRIKWARFITLLSFKRDLTKK